MATSTQHSSQPRTVRRPRRASPRRRDTEYITDSETQALLAGSLADRSARLAADDMVSTDEAATLAGTTRVTINAWIDKGRCIGLTQTKRGFRVPKWQFEPNYWSVVPKLSSALGTTNGWALLAFLETPQGALGGATPRIAIEQGRTQRVLEIAGYEGN
jgi:hypothetical protein